MVHVAGKYVMIRIPEGGARTRDGTLLAEHSYYVQAHQVDEFALLYAVTRIQEIASASPHIIHNYQAVIDNLPF